MTDKKKTYLPREEEAPGDREAMSPEELARYRELLELAYPQPKGDLRASVMAQIGAEAASGTIVPVPTRKSGVSRRKLFVRWGSLAACAALALLIGVQILPGLMSKAELADSALTEPAAFEESIEGSAESNHFYSAANPGDELAESAVLPDVELPIKSGRASEKPDSVGNGLPQPAPNDTAPNGLLGNVPPFAPTPEAEPAMEAPREEPVPEDDFYEGECESFATAEAAYDSAPWEDRSFRCSGSSIPVVLIEKAGEDAYWNWFLSGGRKTLIDFALYFGFTAEDILETGNLWYYVDLPESIPLTEENRETLRAYYENGGDYAGMVRRYTEYEFKNELILEVGASEYARWLESRNGTSLRSWTVSELAEAFDLAEETLRAAYERSDGKVADEYPGYERPGYEELTKS